MDFAAHVNHRLVQRVTQVRAGVATDQQISRLRHEPRHVADGATDHDVAALHGDSAARGTVALDHHQAAVARGGCALRGITLNAHAARHDVLGHAPTHVAVHLDVSLLVHTTDEVAGIAAHVHLDRGIQAYRDIMHAFRIQDLDYSHSIGEQPMMQVVYRFRSSRPLLATSEPSETSS